jgi:hypothetical protein
MLSFKATNSSQPYGQHSHTDKKENEIFLIYKEIQMGSVAKSYMRKGFLIQYIRKCANIYPNMRRPLEIYMTLQPLQSEFSIHAYTS